MAGAWLPAFAVATVTALVATPLLARKGAASAHGARLATAAGPLIAVGFAVPLALGHSRCSERGRARRGSVAVARRLGARRRARQLALVDGAPTTRRGGNGGGRSETHPIRVMPRLARTATL